MLKQLLIIIHRFNYCIELDHNDDLTWNGKGNTLNSLGRYNEALDESEII